MQPVAHPRCLNRNQSENIRGTQKGSPSVAAFRSLSLPPVERYSSAPKAQCLETFLRPRWSFRGWPFAPFAPQPVLPPRPSPVLLLRCLPSVSQSVVPWPLSLFRFAVPEPRCVARGREPWPRAAVSVVVVAVATVNLLTTSGQDQARNHRGGTET